MTLARIVRGGNPGRQHLLFFPFLFFFSQFSFYSSFSHGLPSLFFIALNGFLLSCPCQSSDRGLLAPFSASHPLQVPKRIDLLQDTANICALTRLGCIYTRTTHRRERFDKRYGSLTDSVRPVLVWLASLPDLKPC